MPLRTYSTGMRVRLALGVVTSIDPESCCSAGRPAPSAPSSSPRPAPGQRVVSARLGFASHPTSSSPTSATPRWRTRPDPRRGPLRGCCTTTRAATYWRARVAVKALPPGSVVAVVITGTGIAGRAGLARQTDPPHRAPHRRRQRAGSVRARGRGLRAARHLAAVVAQPRRRGRLRRMLRWRWARAGSGSPTTTAGQPTTTSSPPSSGGRPAWACGRLPHRGRRRRPRPARVPRAPRPHLAPLTCRACRRHRARRRPRAPPRDRRAVQRRAVPDVHVGRHRRAGPAAVHPRRRGGDAPAARALRAALRHRAGCGVPAPAGRRRRQADARGPPARPRPRRPREALLHVPQPPSSQRSRGCNEWGWQAARFAGTVTKRSPREFARCCGSCEGGWSHCA